MIIVTTTATVTYSCWLSEEDSQKVIDYASENNLELSEAIADLYGNNEIDLYKHSTESDFSTESIDEAEEIEND